MVQLSLNDKFHLVCGGINQEAYDCSLDERHGFLKSKLMFICVFNLKFHVFVSLSHLSEQWF